MNAYLDLAELQAERNIPMTMKDWENRLNGFLQIMDYGVLSDNGKVSAEMARIHAESEFEKYRKIQDVIYESDFDRFMELEDKMNMHLAKKYYTGATIPHIYFKDYKQNAKRICRNIFLCCVICI